MGEWVDELYTTNKLILKKGQMRTKCTLVHHALSPLENKSNYVNT